MYEMSWVNFCSNINIVCFGIASINTSYWMADDARLALAEKREKPYNIILENTRFFTSLLTSPGFTYSEEVPWCFYLICHI